MTDSADDQPHRLVRALVAARSYWDRHSGLDGVIRVGGAVAVVVTIEALAGYFLWRGTTESVRIPATLGWSLQFGLTGGSVVGTRAFHRGHSEDKWWGLATSLVAVLFVVADASMAALLLNELVDVNPGFLAVGVLVETLVIGYLTVHTLMSAPRREIEHGAAPEATPEVTEPAEPAEELGVVAEGVLLPSLPDPESEQAGDELDDQDDDARDVEEHDVDHRLIAWHELTKDQAQAEARRLTARGHRVTQSRKTLEQLQSDVRDARRLLGEEPAA